MDVNIFTLINRSFQPKGAAPKKQDAEDTQDKKAVVSSYIS
jgi:hypothetical protein